MIIFYIFVFFNSMTRTDNDNLSEQVQNNSLSGEMVGFVLLTMTIMVCDRILYSTHKFLSH